MPSFLYNVVLSLGHVPCWRFEGQERLARRIRLMTSRCKGPKHQQLAIKVTMHIKVCLKIMLQTVDVNVVKRVDFPLMAVPVHSLLY
jgi:hypothetical protein